MSYALYDINGEVGPLCTFIGWEQVAGFIEKQSGLFELKTMLEDGYTSDIPGTLQDIDYALDTATGEAASTLRNLRGLLQQAKVVGIVSQ